MTTCIPSFKPGEIRTRAEIRVDLGGSPQGGICPSVPKKAVSLFSDHSVGAQYGYQDGWLLEEDELGPIFEYTGAGAQGHQNFDNQGNAAILEHVRDGRTLHVFVAEGKVPGSDTRTHRYVGEFKVDERRPYYMRQGLGLNKAQRMVIVFRLRPAGPVDRTPLDLIPPATKTEAIFVRAEATVRPREPRRRRREKDQEATAEAIAQRQREELSAAYEHQLSAAHHDVGRMQVQIEGQTEQFLTNLYDASENTLYEPAGNVSREALKSALAQLLDYSRYLRSREDVLPLRRMVLLPGIPTLDIRSLLAEHDVGIIYRDSGTGEFLELSPGARRGRSGPGAPPVPCVGCPTLTA